MNAPLRPRPEFPPPEPLPKAPRKYTADDIFFWLSTGFVAPDAKFELLDGELIPVSPKERVHEAMRERLEDWLTQSWAASFRIIREHTLKLDNGTLLEPDFLIYDRAARIKDRPLQGADIRLAIEVADSSWSYDTTRKAAKYAQFGIAEYWAIHAVKREARVYRGPKNEKAGAEGWASIEDIPAGSRFAPLCAAEAGFDLGVA